MKGVYVIAAVTAYLLTVSACIGGAMYQAASGSQTLLDHENLFAWGTSVDSKHRTGEALAQMLEGLGLKQVAYNWEDRDISNFDEQIEAFKRHNIRILAWAVTDVDYPTEPIDWRTYQLRAVVSAGEKASPLSVLQLLMMFRRHGISPQIWLIRRWTAEDDDQSFMRYSPEEQASRLRQETDRIKALAELAAPFGVVVGLYKHAGWIGITDNQLAIVKKIRSQGFNNVGIVYQFIHARDEVDDTVDFPATWQKLKPFVLAVNITGVHAEREIFPVIYPSQGDLELHMLKTIQISGWKGPVG